MNNPFIRVTTRFYKIVAKWYLAPLLIKEYKNPMFKEMNERPIEYGFALKWLSQICPTYVLDVGSGTSAWPHVLATCGYSVTAIDQIKNYWKDNLFNRHYHILHDDITNPKIDKKFDFITCISVLEHIPDHKDALRGMFKLLNKDGCLLITVPYNEEHYVDNIYANSQAGYGKEASFICQVFSRNEINDWLNTNQGKIVEQKYYEVFSGEFWTFGKRIYPPREVSQNDKHHLTCIMIK